MLGLKGQRKERAERDCWPRPQFLPCGGRRYPSEGQCAASAAASWSFFRFQVSLPTRVQGGEAETRCQLTHTSHAFSNSRSPRQGWATRSGCPSRCSSWPLCPQCCCRRLPASRTPWTATSRLPFPPARRSVSSSPCP